ERARRAARVARVSTSHSHRDLRFGRDVLQALLFPRRQDRGDHRRDGAKSANDEAAAARRSGVRPISSPQEGAGGVSSPMSLRTTRPLRRVQALVLATTLAGAIIAWRSTTGISAHAILLAADPAKGSSVAGPSIPFSLTFNERIDAKRST